MPSSFEVAHGFVTHSAHSSVPDRLSSECRHGANHAGENGVFALAQALVAARSMQWRRADERRVDPIDRNSLTRVGSG